MTDKDEKCAPPEEEGLEVECEEVDLSTELSEKTPEECQRGTALDRMEEDSDNELDSLKQPVSVHPTWCVTPSFRTHHSSSFFSTFDNCQPNLTIVNSSLHPLVGEEKIDLPCLDCVS